MSKKNKNMLYCHRHKGYFFSRKYAEHNVVPVQCPKCKRLDWNKEDKNG